MIVTKEELVNGKNKLFLKILLNGSFGTGKTYTSMTFPKWAYAMFEPHGIQTAYTNPHLLQNMVYYESFIPSKTEDIKDLFVRLTAFLGKVKLDIESGLVETCIIDPLSHLSEYRFMFIDKYEKTFTQKGAVDSRAMYGTLTRWLNKFILTEVLALPCHVVINCHIQDEMEEDDGKLIKTGKIIPDTLGSFRKDAPKLVNGSLFLEVKPLGQGKYKFRAQCLPGYGKDAKNNLGLPEFVEDVSYEKLIQSINNNTTKQ